ncbi:MAG: glycosyltransferase family 2 protein [Cyanobacteriota bacterium]
MTDPFPMASDAVPRVSVVVMSFNRPQALERCLASLAAQTLAKEQFEVVLVDVSDPPNHPQVAQPQPFAIARHLRVVRGIGHIHQHHFELLLRQRLRRQ